MNILHLVLGCKNEHYSKIFNAAKETWVKNSPDNIKTIFMYGGNDKIFWDGEESFYVDSFESLNICLYKTLLAFEQFLEFDFDYIFRSNITGYFDYKLINEFISNKPKTQFYCGIIGKFNGSNFASGSGYFLSKDLVNLIVKNKNILYNYNLPGYFDDVSVGKFITENLKVNINPSAKRLNIHLNEISENLDISHYHYRILPKGNAEAIYKIHKIKNNNQTLTLSNNYENF